MSTQLQLLFDVCVYPNKNCKISSEFKFLLNLPMSFLYHYVNTPQYFFLKILIFSSFKNQNIDPFNVNYNSNEVKI